MNHLYYNFWSDTMYIVYKDGRLECYGREGWKPSLFRTFKAMYAYSGESVEFVGEI